jgi:sugar (pentulose or hexulose) kinase
MCEESQVTNPGGVAIAYFVHHRPHPPDFPVRIPNVLVARPEATIADKTRAIVENVGNLIVRMIEEFSEKGILESTSEIFTAGGGSDLEYLLRYISDVTGRTIHRLAMREATARGAAFAARASLLGLEEPYGPALEEVTATYYPTNPDRRRRYLQWQRLEQDVLNNSLPAHAEIEE